MPGAIILWSHIASSNDRMRPRWRMLTGAVGSSGLSLHFVFSLSLFSFLLFFYFNFNLIFVSTLIVPPSLCRLLFTLSQPTLLAAMYWRWASLV
jgi:hypothetical protein